ncbi:response regulator [Dankookia sp. P2]|uniref:response regulator n=1 Tax=Dankookia sp. P2 TaxID=3423955 RepID=UPI003D66405E
MQLSSSDIGPHEAATPGDFVSICIQDNGTGMTPEVLEHVLEPFFTTKPQGEGTGLGLSQVYGFVLQSSGLLRIDSAPAHGTTMQILLPHAEVAPNKVAEDPARGAMSTPARGETVLLVDDETAVRVPTAERLRDLGYHVVEAEDGPKALRLVGEGLRPDVLVTDIGLPGGMDGRAVADELRRQRPDLPVVFATGDAQVALPDDAVVVAKPFDLDVLVARVDDALRREQ